MKYYDWEPGNGTRYQVLFVQVDDPEIAKQLSISPGGWVVSLMNFGQTTMIEKEEVGRCYAFQPTAFRPDGILVPEYVQEKFKLGYIKDAEALTQLIGYVTGREIPRKWPKCPMCDLPMVPGKEQCVGCEYSETLHV